MKWLTDHHLPVWLLPLAFPIVAIGVIWLLGTIVGRIWPEKQDANAGPKQTASIWVVGFGAFFALGGLTTLVFGTLYPTYRSFRADAWPTTPGTVLSSKLAGEEGSTGGSTLRIDIRYRYTVAGREYDGTRYDSSVGTTGFRAIKQGVVNAIPPGRSVTVHYNPADPADAMLTTTTPPGTFRLLWIPFVFVGVGVAIMVAGLRTGRRAGFLNMRPGAAPRPATAVPLAPVAGDARASRRKHFIGIAVFALFWNGIVVSMSVASPTWCLLPFLVIGGLVLLLAIHSGLRLLNPIVGVTFARMPLRPSTRTDVTFTVGGNYLAVRQLAFSLEGRERVTYQQGTNSRTETHVAWRLPLYETVRAVDLERGRFAIDLPADVMPTFIATNNRLTWHLCCRGELPAFRPNISDDFDVTVAADEGTR